MKIAVALLIIGVFALRAAVNQPVAPKSGKASLPLRIAVLPFGNASGNAALDDWQQAWPGLVRTFLKEATPLEAPNSKRIKPALERGGWDAQNSGEATARSIAFDLKAKVVVWGRITRRTNMCVAMLNVLRLDPGKGPVEMEIVSSNWVALAESAAVRLTEHLGQTHSTKELAYWRSQLPSSDKSLGLLGRAIALDIAEAPRTDQENVLRESLLEDKQCAYAYSILLQLLIKDRRSGDSRAVAAEFFQHRPDICSAHLAMAHAHMEKGDENAAEREMREALRRHAGCPGAMRGLFFLATKQQGDPGDTAPLLEEAFRLHPNDEQIKIFLASARAFKDDVDGARELLITLEELPPEDEYLDQILFKASLWTDSFELIGRELLRLGPQAVTNADLREELTEVAFTNRAGSFPPNMRRTAPRKLTSAALQSELGRLLSPEERALVVNPVAVTPELVAEAQRLTVGLPNDATRILALFSEVARRGRGRNEGPRHTASEALKASRNPQNRFVCQEYAKLFVGLTRAIGIESWLVHIDRDAFGFPAYHDCAAILLEGEVVLVDPTWRFMFIPHQESSVLDDVQAISHHLMQSLPDKPDPRRLRAGLKLNPDDHWTRVQFVRQMAEAGEVIAAEEEMKRLEREPKKWDTHFVSAKLHETHLRWSQAVEELKRALALSPSNAVVHTEIAKAYEQLGKPHDMEKHLTRALELDRGEISSEMRENASVWLTIRKANNNALSIEEALDKLRKAAEQGNALAQLNYASSLLSTRGKEAAKEALTWITRAAEQGMPDAQHNLGSMLYEGKLVPEDMVAAYTWMSLAAAQEHKKAKSMLRYMEIFIHPDQLTEARKRVAAFKPKIKLEQ